MSDLQVSSSVYMSSTQTNKKQYLSMSGGSKLANTHNTSNNNSSHCVGRQNSEEDEKCINNICMYMYMVVLMILRERVKAPPETGERCH